MKFLSASIALLACATSVEAFNANKAFRFGAKAMPEVSSESATTALSAGGAEKKSYDLDITEIFDGNKKFIETKKAQDAAYFDTLGTVHSPKYLYIGCVDARAPPNMIMGTEAGTMLTVRNIANMVVNNDLAVMSAIQFGINVLKIPHVIVCGHYECGGVRASVANVDHAPPLSIWLRNIRDVYRLHARELDAIKDPEDRHRRLVDLNVIEQCVNLYKTGVIQAKRIESYQEGAPAAIPRVHPIVFDPKTGAIRKLQVDFDKYMSELDAIYDLYELENAKIPA
jgi:carbonic anhydrase|uniref:Carbonic anhydrase n=1 Tax=Phaeodactylum tricornutum TaxID=2850 RepID=Q945G8_PHATR|nr:intracellular beta-type carbonic anhydrase [Phaeodactylum tricornutum]QIP67671.1 beta-carbonic anhydrase 1 [Nitzschia sp. ICE-H]